MKYFIATTGGSSSTVVASWTTGQVVMRQVNGAHSTVVECRTTVLVVAGSNSVQTEVTLAIMRSEQSEQNSSLQVI